MTNPLGMADFFALESGDYLERLATLCSAPEPVAADFVRFTRALRGCALMANQQAIARAASGLEAIARAYRDGRQRWDLATRERVLRAIAQFRTLTSHAGTWSEADTALVERLARDLDADQESPTTQRAATSAHPSTLDPGVRAFIAREGASVATALDAAARALRASSAATGPLQAVLQRAQSLRGLAILADLSPLPEILDAIERAIAEVSAQGSPAKRFADVFDQAAVALTRGSRDVVQHGRPEPDAEEARRFADTLLRELVLDGEVSIEALFFDDDADGVVQRGTPPSAPPARTSLNRVQLISHAEHLCEAADSLERTRYAVERDLRLYTAVAALRALGETTGDGLVQAAATFARLAISLATAGVAGADARGFAAGLREAGALLRSTPASSDDAAAVERLGEITAQLGRLRGHRDASPAVAQPAAAVAPEPEPDLGGEIVPIETLLESVAAPAAVESVSTLEKWFWTDQSQALGEAADLAGSFITYQRLLSEAPEAAPVPEALLSPVSETGTATGTADEESPVDIATLCYRGRAALERAATLRANLATALATNQAASTVRPMLDELFDLVDLALADRN